ncbi:cupin domain-containing protein [Roseivivax sediminis]|uniref:Cupin domain protein n=1 Tax=Roseivivax sediminis TaxID=936889 RepID=A0A1I2C9S1_9RHOB|nr:cupin domain-containing protein [Roseivivax sediminis]SFE64968.1 Cupin domain protein [Roseivivax sediminis]
MKRTSSACPALLSGLLVAEASATPVSAQEQAITRTPDDPALEWGPCPGFMPEDCQIAVLHGDPAKSNPDIFYRVPGGAEIARHWHNSPERMVLVTGEMGVTYDGQDRVVLSPGTYAYGPAKKPHGAICLSSDPCTLFIAFVDPIDAMAGGPE